MKDLSEKYLKNTQYSVIKAPLSFITRLFSHDQVLLVCQLPKTTTKKSLDESLPFEQSTLMDITGSPLKCSLIDPTFEISIAPVIRNWFIDEEKYFPIDKKDGLEYISYIKEMIEPNDENSKLPIFCVINPETDDKRTVVVGCYSDEKAMHTYIATQNFLELLSNLKNDFKSLIAADQKEFFSEAKNSEVVITSSYELLGTNSRMIDWSEQPKKDFTGFLKIDTSWNILSFVPPSVTLSNNLVAEIVCGSNSNPFHQLWDQILLINKYLIILEEYCKRDSSSRYSVKPLNFPKNFSTPFLKDDKTVKLELNCLISGSEKLLEKSLKNQQTNSDIENIHDIQLNNVLNELPTRQNMDFTDKFWNIIRGTDNYQLMTDCVYDIFDLVLENNCKPQLNDISETRFAKLLSSVVASREKLSLHAGSLSLELVIDMAIEKLDRDYTYLLSSMNFINVCNLREISTNVSEGEFSIQKYRNKLIKIAEVHVAFEFLQLIQSKFSCRNHISQFIFESGLKVSKDKNKPVTFEENVYSLNVPTPREFMSQIPSTWMFSISSSNELQMFSTIRLFSRSSIFPANIYTPSEKTLRFKAKSTELIYHAVSAQVTSFNLS